MIFSMWGPNDSTLPDTTVGGTERPHCANGEMLEGTDRLFLVFDAPDTDTAFKFHKKVQDTGSLVIDEGDGVIAVVG